MTIFNVIQLIIVARCLLGILVAMGTFGYVLYMDSIS